MKKETLIKKYEKGDFNAEQYENAMESLREPIMEVFIIPYPRYLYVRKEVSNCEALHFMRICWERVFALLKKESLLGRICNVKFWYKIKFGHKK